MGMQGGFTKYCCFLCLWDSRATDYHYNVNDWPPTITYEPGTSRVQSKPPLVDFNKIFLPPLHIKLGLMKNLVKAMGKANSRGFQYLADKFPKVRPVKVKEGISVGPQIREVLKDEDFDKSFKAAELKAWSSFKWLCENFLGNRKSPAYRYGVQNLLTAYKEMECRMTLQIHFLDSHLEFFPENLGSVSDEQANVFINIFKEWKIATKVSGMKV